jgi:SAM-dependent methyltransferase
MSDQSLWNKLQTEVSHWLRRNWSFAAVGQHWDATEDYDSINQETYSYYRRFEDGLRLSHGAQKARVLDFCARTGYGSLAFHQAGRLDVAVCADVSWQMGKICRQRLAECGVERMLWLPLTRLPFPLADASFDTVLCFETIEHFPDPESIVLELGRLTRPGGTLILTTPNILWEPIHALAAITELHHSEGPHRFLGYRRLLRCVQQAGFEIEARETTVLIPGGPTWLVKWGEWIERHSRHWLMPIVGLRRIVIGRKI